MGHHVTLPLLIVLAGALLVGCFKENLAYHKDSGPPADLPAGWDGPGWDGEAELGGHDSFSADVVPWPDQQALPCTSDAQCNDNLSCTTDVCAAGKCANKLAAKSCLIGGKCYGLAQKNPGNSCQVCDSTKTTTKWTTEGDKAPCAKDSLACTADYCIKGKCTHPLSSGCLIGGQCVGENEASATNKCQVCVSDVSKTAYTTAVGAPCTPGGGKAGMCLSGNTCAGFNQKLYTAKGAYHTSLRSVDYIPGATAVWAAGMYQETDKGATKGVLVEATASSSVSEVFTSDALSDLHYRMAVGDKGTVMYHDGKTWTAATWLATPLGTADRFSVWGANVNGTLTFYLTARQSSTVAAVTRCTLGATFACEAHSGVASGAALGRIVGTQVSGGGQGNLWAAVMGEYADPEDIYNNPGNTKAWSTNGPKGCKDSGGTPCSNTSAETLDLEGSGNDLWLVGSLGMILRYDGKSWSKQSKVIPSQASYNFTAVYTSSATKLTTLVAYYDSSSSQVHRVRLFNYNHTLKRWFGPITIAETPYQSPDLILDIGGQGYSDLWMVGQREILGSSGKPQLAGWMLQLK